MDINTMILALALGNLSLCTALFFFEQERRRTGLGPDSISWARARQCQLVAWGLIYLHGTLPDILTVALANGLLCAGFALDASALWEQAGRRVWRRYMLPALVVALSVLSGTWLLEVSAHAHTALLALVLGWLFLTGAAALARGWRSATLLRRYLVLAALLLALALMTQGVLAVLLPAASGGGLTSPSSVQGAGLLVLYLMLWCHALAYLLLGREQQQASLARLEVVDALTDVPNQRGFYQALAPWIALARRPGMPTALIVLKLDHFKRINDSYGHLVGDQVLKAMVDACKLQLRDSDLMGRLGGAEFAIQLPRTSLDDALLVAERIRNAVAALPVKAGKAVINMSASLGVTTIRADDSAISLVKRADEALQQARQGGRNRVAQAAAVQPA